MPTLAPPSAVCLLADADMITADAPKAAAVVVSTLVALEQPAAAVRSARLASTACGVYEARIGDKPVSEAVLSPGWSAYEWRLAVQDVDVTDLIASGGQQVEVAFELGNGWFRGELGFDGAKVDYGPDIGVIGVLEITFDDGHVQCVSTNPSWVGHRSATTENSLYRGQRIDARLRATREPLAVRGVPFDRHTLVVQEGPDVIRHESLRPQRIWESPSGRTLVDFGQNLVGWVRSTVQGPEGAEITLRHAEVLEHGELATRPLRAATSTDTFVLSGGDDQFEPTFTFHGFRYAEVTGWPGALSLDSLEAVVVHSRIRRTSKFSSSHVLLDRFMLNSVWGQRGNFLGIPTDCPQRDERLGWTGDIAVYAATAATQFDVADLLHVWLADVEAESRASEKGVVPLTVPDILKKADLPPTFPRPGATAIWGDAAVWVPQALWNAYGDIDRLARHYPLIAMHLESVESAVSETGLWDAGIQLGDWLDPDGPPDQPWMSKADRGVVATACLFRSASFAGQAARLLGRAADEERWAALASRTRAAFVTHYVEQGRIRSDCATVYALAIAFGVLEGDQRAIAGRRLAEIVRERDFLVSTGFAGTPYVTWALSETGHVAEAYRLLLEERCPSWLYPATMGATTVWERWDSMLPDGSINAGDMTSFNHYALGAVADWVFQVVAGIRPAEAGFRRVRIEPVPGPGLDHVEAERETPAGPVGVQWSVADGRFDLDLSLPEGVTADVVLPDGYRTEVTGGLHSFSARL